MKKIFTVMIFLIVCTSGIYAADLTLGASAGFNAGWFSGNDWDELIDYVGGSNEAKGGFTIGLFLDAPLNEFFSIQPEINFIVSGGGISADNLYDSTYDVYYDEELIQTAPILQIPLLAKFKIPVNKNRITLSAGPMIGFLLGDIKMKDKVTVSGYGSDTSEFDLEADNSTVFGFTVGAGYEFKTSGGVLITDIRYSHTFTGFFDDDDTRVNNFGVNIGYGFNL